MTIGTGKWSILMEFENETYIILSESVIHR